MDRDRVRNPQPDWSTTEIGLDARGTTGPGVQTKRLPRVSKTQGTARESALVGRITRVLDSTPGCYHRNIHGDQYHSGIPDIIGCLHGFFFAIEIKQDGLKPSKIQKEEIKKVLSCRGFAESFDNFELFHKWWTVFDKLAWKKRMRYTVEGVY